LGWFENESSQTSRIQDCLRIGIKLFLMRIRGFKRS
jgi:hypothetical protein